MEPHPLGKYSQLAALKAKLLSHPIYAQVNSLQRIRMFMGSHVFAVWDFMSLLKRLQCELTCTTLPWFPLQDARSARLINEIVLAEESDIGIDGSPVSHLGLYLAAMEEIGADTSQFQHFSEIVREGAPVEQALSECGAPAHVNAFVTTTMGIAFHATTEDVMAVFLHGREDIIPAMFQRVLHGFDSAFHVPCFKFYLKRHIEIDSETHAPAATEILGRLIRADPIVEAQALEAAMCAIQARIDFFAGIERSFAYPD